MPTNLNFCQKILTNLKIWGVWCTYTQHQKIFYLLWTCAYHFKTFITQSLYINIKSLLETYTY